MPLDELLRGIWQRRWAVALAAVLVFGLGAGLIVSWPRHYVAQAMVAPAETSGVATSTLMSPSPLLQGGLLDNRPSGNFGIYLDALRAPEAAAMLARETGLLAYLSDLRGAGAMGALRRHLGWRIEADLDDAESWLAQRFAATQGIATTTVTLTLEHRDRAAALDMLRRLHAMAETRVRAGLLGQARQRMAAIEARLATEPDQFQRSALYELLAAQQRIALVLGADEAVAARIVSAPMVGIRPSLPNRPLLLVLLAVAAPLASLLAAACLVLLRGPARARPVQYEMALGPRRLGAGAD
ncbi:Wzz/FepE/Etk N-terminal domain-containing protein [Belnapia sp. F-4-1]|uniref:Wzz/FepE/Etk N-terminal domain-containing protein n=1 Tax=Belnapia sp. F-4-1 TaxID=1545443 RepID=UPI0005BA91CA|nr:Wzz/FepE/Etk N-terminal domain-containing protein [Belnapia sp. F-4-1]